MKNFLVVGSGPSGVSAALALLKLGNNVTMVDVGNDLPQEISLAINSISKISPEDWSSHDKSIIRPGHLKKNNKVPEKLLFGNNFVYKDSNLIIGNDGLSNGFSQYPSLAYGGLSRIWGAATMRLHPSDISSWPELNLNKYYEIIEQLIPISAKYDSLAKDFGFPKSAISLPISSQSDKILSSLNKSKYDLNKMGITFGQSRLAIKEKCVLCSNCLNGCPYGKIFSSVDLMGLLHEFPKFKYMKGIRVINFEENIKSVKINCKDLNDSNINFEVDRLFIGAGALSSALLIMKSLRILGRNIFLMDSQYFLMPFLGYSSISEEKLHTLSQLFIEISNKDLSNNNIHSQIYTYNNLYLDEINATLGRLNYIPGIKYLSNLISKRLYLAQSYLHSNDSPGANIRLNESANHAFIRVTPNPHSENMHSLINKIWDYLKVVGIHGGIKAFPSLGRIADVGQGYHSGGTFPMSNQPKDFSSDIYGRPLMQKRVHLIDSSVLPSIPSGTITLTVMANAYRIAEQGAQLD